MDMNHAFTAAVQLLLVLLGISVHESARAWAAYLSGDTTARDLGRTSLNPLVHVEVFGSLLLPALQIAFGLLPFGWGKPAPVQPESFRRPGWDDILVAGAGSAANLLLAAASAVALIAAVGVLGPEARQAAYLTLIRQVEQAGSLPGFPVMFTLVQMALINAFLGVFNLIPLPPLDGGQIALQLLPADWAAKFAAIRPYGFMIGLVLAMFGVVTALLSPFYVVLYIVLSA